MVAKSVRLPSLMTTISKRYELETAITVLSCLSSNVSDYKDGPSRTANVQFQKREEDTEDRLKLTLDALAKICLSSAQGQVITTTIAITQSPARRVELFISANTKTTLQPSLVNYIESIWASLKKLSNPHFHGPARLEHSPAPDTSVINDLGAKVYQNCSVKFFQILKKRFGQFQRFSAFIRQREGALPEFFTDTEEYLNVLHNVSNRPHPSWLALSMALNAGYLQIREVIEQEEWLSAELAEYQKHILRE
jgi:hypothetical protein